MTFRSNAHVYLALAVTITGCGSTSPRDGASAFPDPAPGGDGTADDGGGAGFVDAGTFSTEAGADPDAGPPKVLFYANDDTTLYQLDPADLSAPLVTVGKFDCVPSGTSVMTDIAVSKEGKLYGVSPAAAWPLTLQGNGVVHCDAKWPLPYDTHFNGLTFAPAGVLGPDEVLIGGNATGQLFRIDQGTGAVTQVGTLGSDTGTGRPWSVSGDIVFMANGGHPIGFATARTCTDATTCTSVDTLLEIDVGAVAPGTQSVLKAVRGPITKGKWCGNAGSPSTFGSIYGIVAYQDKVYGFSRRGDFLDVLNDDGSGCLEWSNSATRFAGAGITTLAPVTAPPPR